jgi:hypothetical protein
MNVLQQGWVGECTSRLLTIKEDPLFWDSLAIDAVLGMEGCTPVFLFFN